MLNTKDEVLVNVVASVKHRGITIALHLPSVNKKTEAYMTQEQIKDMRDRVGVLRRFL